MVFKFLERFGGQSEADKKYKKGTSDNPQTHKKEFKQEDDVIDESAMTPEEILIAKEEKARTGAAAMESLEVARDDVDGTEHDDVDVDPDELEMENEPGISHVGGSSVKAGHRENPISEEDKDSSFRQPAGERHYKGKQYQKRGK